MNELKIFENSDFGKVRTTIIAGQPHFVGKDVAEILGYSNSRKAIIDHVDDEDKGVTKCDTLGGEQELIVINESGLYSLILSSKMPQAKQFKHWVTSEVLPAIRQTGGYINGEETMTDDELIANALLLAKRKLADREKRIGQLEVDNSKLTVEKQILQPKADYFDELVDRNLLTSFRDTAKQLGVKQNDFVSYLIEKKYVYRDQKGKLMPYAVHNDLFHVKECVNEKTQWSGVQTLITPKGRETFRLLLEGCGA